MLHKERYAPARQLAGICVPCNGSTPAAQAWLGFTPSPQAGP